MSEALETQEETPPNFVSKATNLKLVNGEIKHEVSIFDDPIYGQTQDGTWYRIADMKEMTPASFAEGG